MATIALVTGGCRSGKSAYALAMGESLSPSRAYIATSPVTDPEMQRRIEAHQKARSQRGWVTIEEQLDLAGVLRRQTDYNVLVVDCVTLWINNLMHQAGPQPSFPMETDIEQKCREIIDAGRGCRGTVIFVTNEVGLGIVPEAALARHYRDLLGRANQVLAASADTVILMVCGIPWPLKPPRSPSTC